MATWLFIGTIFGTMIVLAFLFGRSRNALGRDGQRSDPAEDRRRIDVLATDEARKADARAPPFQGSSPY